MPHLTGPVRHPHTAERPCKGAAKMTSEHWQMKVLHAASVLHAFHMINMCINWQAHSMKDEALMGPAMQMGR